MLHGVLVYVIQTLILSVPQHISEEFGIEPDELIVREVNH